MSLPFASHFCIGAAKKRFHHPKQFIGFCVDDTFFPYSTLCSPLWIDFLVLSSFIAAAAQQRTQNLCARASRGCNEASQQRRNIFFVFFNKLLALRIVIYVR
jgi:hypothetical protein